MVAGAAARGIQSAITYGQKLLGGTKSVGKSVGKGAGVGAGVMASGESCPSPLAISFLTCCFAEGGGGGTGPAMPMVRFLISW